jgi:hypothetical protein
MVIILTTALVLAIIFSLTLLFNFHKACQEKVALLRQINKLGDKAEEYRLRTIELEDGIEKSFGISVRQNVTEVKCVFSKQEMVFIMAGIFKLIKSESGSIEDKEYLIGLYKKSQEVVDKMKDLRETEVEGSGD